MATTIQQRSGTPTYPDPPEGLSDAAAALDPAFVWHRLESYCAHRWAEREVVFIAEGPGHWEPPLVPATVTKAEVWRHETWEEIVLPASPLGGFLLRGVGPYRFTADVGSDTVPAPVAEAFRRLAEYMAAHDPARAGHRTRSITAGSVSLRTSGHEAAAARAMQNSGAGDLLRSYRRAG